MEFRSKPWALAYFAFLTSSPAADYKKLNLVPSIISDELIAKDRLPWGGRLKIAFTMASSRKACQACILCDAKVFSLSTHLRLTITWIIVIQGGLLHVHIAVKRIRGCQNSLSTCTSATQQDRLKCPHCCSVTKTKKPRFQGFLTIILRAVPGSNKFSGSRV